MTARILDGQALAARMQEEIRPEVAAFVEWLKTEAARR